ncbi:MAG TPA: FeS-binding protein, partial [Actinomycetes bacterium]|nr:FeS-binding protein [Actinomycetes bacterium]
ERIGKRVNLERTDEALATGADVVGTACPYCMVMLDDAIKQRQAEGTSEGVRVLDVAQVLEQSVQARERPRCSSQTGCGEGESLRAQDCPGSKRGGSHGPS